MNLCNHAWTVDRTPPGGELDLIAFRRKDTAAQYALERGGAVRKTWSGAAVISARCRWVRWSPS